MNIEIWLTDFGGSPLASFEFPNQIVKQGRFYVPSLLIGDKKYFVQFSYLWTESKNYSDRDFWLQTTDAKIGYYLDRKTGEPVKAHIWIGEKGTQKRAEPEVYQTFLDRLKHNVFCGWDENSKPAYYPADKIIFSETK